MPPSTATATTAEAAAEEGARSSFEYWQCLARAIEEGAGGEGLRDPEVAEVLREGISFHPTELELYLTLGHVHERQGDVGGALDVYLAFPPPLDGEPPGFDHAMVASQVAKLLIEQKEFAGADGPTPRSQLLVDSLVTVGRRLGVLNIEQLDYQGVAHGGFGQTRLTWPTKK